MEGIHNCVCGGEADQHITLSKLMNHCQFVTEKSQYSQEIHRGETNHLQSRGGQDLLAEKAGDKVREGQSEGSSGL